MTVIFKPRQIGSARPDFSKSHKFGWRTDPIRLVGGIRESFALVQMWFGLERSTTRETASLAVRRRRVVQWPAQPQHVARLRADEQ
jgi:hypothetical protein